MGAVKKSARKIAVAIAGFVVLIAGIIMLVVPGPGILVIILGLLILSTEYEWAKGYLDRAKAAQKKALEKAQRKKTKKSKNT